MSISQYSVIVIHTTKCSWWVFVMRTNPGEGNYKNKTTIEYHDDVETWFIILSSGQTRRSSSWTTSYSILLTRNLYDFAYYQQTQLWNQSEEEGIFEIDKKWTIMTTDHVHVFTSVVCPFRDVYCFICVCQRIVHSFGIHGHQCCWHVYISCDDLMMRV